MDDNLQKAVNNLKSDFAGQEKEFRGQVTVLLQPEHLLPALTRLRDEFTFDMLVAETAVDYWPKTDSRFNVIYQVYSTEKNSQLRIRVPLEGNAPSLPTAEGVYPKPTGMNGNLGYVWYRF